MPSDRVTRVTHSGRSGRPPPSPDSPETRVDTSTSRTPSRSALLVPVLCWLALTADGYDLFAYGATVPGLLAAPGWGATPASVGAVASLGLVGMLCGSLVAGTLTDLLGRRRLFAASGAAPSSPTGSPPFSGSPPPGPSPRRPAAARRCGRCSPTAWARPPSASGS